MSLRTTLLAALVSLSPLVAPLSARTEEPTRPWTLMIYGAAANNADGPILDFLDSLRQGLDDDPGMELILFLDRSEGFSDDASSLGADFTGARIYRLRRDTAELLDADDHFPGMSEEGEYEVDSADPANVGQFVAFCKERFPARNYGLMIYSHANGCTMCPDEESGRDMHIPELTTVVGQGASVDFLALELCNMGGIEIGYQWRPGNGGFSADVLVAIPNAGPPLDWDRAFRRLRSPGHDCPVPAQAFDPATLSAQDFGNLVVEEGRRGRRAMMAAYPEHADRMGREAAACYDLSRAADVKGALDALAVELAEGDDRGAFEALRGKSGDARVMNYMGGELLRYPYVDLFDLARAAALDETLSEPVRRAARRLAGVTDAFVLSSFGMPGLGGFEPGQHGVFLVFPDGDATLGGAGRQRRAFELLDWYTPLPQEEDGDPYGAWSFCADGAIPDNGQVENWFELLDHWYDPPTGDDPGGSNRYVP